MTNDRTPPLAEWIGQWTSPQPSPLDVLAVTDDATAIREAYALAVAYRRLAQAALDEAARLTALVERQNDLLRPLVCGEHHGDEQDS